MSDSYHGIIRKINEPSARSTVHIPEAESLDHATRLVKSQMPSDYEIAWLRRRQPSPFPTSDGGES
ncbi:hypothetical protein [Gordonia soli]|uniref:Uncharacterized protein n=1 Tax=Gordonia soli NBRC 108243 TaxID=1223545 RepID=M0QRR6_9ACTN|nr:hypothetical protein [Gordonia soli]GAC71106.1 hypothetical protein GS4_57_00030 [Gordonia soli NBRC 108243]